MWGDGSCLILWKVSDALALGGAAPVGGSAAVVGPCVRRRSAATGVRAVCSPGGTIDVVYTPRPGNTRVGGMEPPGGRFVGWGCGSGSLVSSCPARWLVQPGPAAAGELSAGPRALGGVSARRGYRRCLYPWGPGTRGSGEWSRPGAGSRVGVVGRVLLLSSSVWWVGRPGSGWARWVGSPSCPCPSGGRGCRDPRRSGVLGLWG